MLTLKPYDEIGGGDFGWLKAKHHFAIAGHGNPTHTPLGNLYVLNDDEIAPGAGFPMHSHSDVEIITYVRTGVVSHKDNLGNRGETRAGDVQVMSAGRGIRHSEFNDGTVPTRMFQIWLHPRASGQRDEPRWNTRKFPRTSRTGKFVLLASGYDAPDALPIRADAEILGAVLQSGSTVVHQIPAGHAAYLVPSSGSVLVNAVRVDALSGLVINEESAIAVTAVSDAELVLIVTSMSQTGHM